MTDKLTPLDLAHMAADAEPDDDAARLRFYGLLSDTELFLLLRTDAPDRTTEGIEPAVFALEEGRFALAFDSEERLAEFTGEPAPYAALPGRVLVRQLAGRSIGLGINLGVSPAAALLPPEVTDWLQYLLAQEPDAPAERPIAFETPEPATLALAGALTGAVTAMTAHAAAVVLVTAVYLTGRRAALAVVGAKERRQAAMARAVNDALAFSGMPAAAVDVMFLTADDMLADTALAIGTMIARGQPAPEAASPATGPGMDPSKPPRLR